MRAPIRQIAVSVDEPEAGWFAWVLLEQGLDDWSEIAAADEWVNTYREAMAEGLLALQAMVDDLDTGPRQLPEAAPPSKPKPPSGPFGFGTF